MIEEQELDELVSGGAENLAEPKKTSLLLQELVTIKHILQAQQKAQQKWCQPHFAAPDQRRRNIASA